MTKLRLFIFLTTLIVVGSLSYIVSLYARGYRFDTKHFKLTPSGLLVVKSDPSAAQVLINAELKTATDSTLSLAPGVYDVTIQKDGYLRWSKRLNIEKEVVTEASAFLFKSVPSLSASTFYGVENPVVSSDSTKVAYSVPFLPTPSQEEPKQGLWLIDTFNLPLGFAKDPRRITDADLSDATYIFSPSGREILLTTKEGVFLLDSSTFTPQRNLVNIASKKEEILRQWQKETETKLSAKLKTLPDSLSEILSDKVKAIVFSPDENKILYTASASASIPENLIRPLPGASSQRQERTIKGNQTYVYDIKEDRNFLVSEQPVLINNAATQPHGNTTTPFLRWFPTSRHLILAEEGKITIMDYDGTNRQVVYSGSYIAPHAYHFGDASRLLILTNLGADSSSPNLYALGIK